MRPVLDDALPVTWKGYLFTGLRFLIIFYAATFCLGVLFLCRGEHWQVPGLIFGVLYLCLLFYAARRMIKKLSMAAIMVASPTIPLCMLILVVSLLPTLQAVDQHLLHHNRQGVE